MENTSEKEVRMRKKKFYVMLVTVVIVSLLFGGLVGTYLGAQSQNIEGITYKIKLFMQIIKVVEKDYYRPVTVENLIDYAIRGMLSSLDPHTVYLSEEDYKELLIGTKGSFGGLGIQIGIRDDVLTVITPLEGTPADRAGLLAGDKIVEIESEPTKEINLQEAVKKLRGKPGTDVTIGISREGFDETIHFTITRDIIKVKAVPYYGMVDKNIGYIRLATFSESSTIEFREAIDSLESKGAAKFIIDLRNNSGGLLKSAVEISENFLDKGEIIVSTRGRKIGSSREYYSKKHPKYGNFPVIVLVNGGTASASEIVSGAIQDWDRGLILGTKTYGKGSVQQVIPIYNQSALKITTALYYSPSGRSIDNEVSKKKNTIQFGVALKPADKDTTTYYTKRLHRKVYGGGAVVPDIVYELPKMTELETQIYLKGLFFNFTVDYTSTHKIEKGFSVSQSMLDSFKEFLRAKDLKFEEMDFEKSLDGIKLDLKRTISLKMWGLKSSYESVLYDDKQVAKSVQILNKTKKMDELFSFIPSSQ